MTNHSIAEGLDWLNSLTNFERKLPKKYVATTFNTDRYRQILEKLGDPHLSEIPTVQILGTDGKGSTLAFLEALLNRAGKRTHSFISPHLVSVEERFRSDGEDISTHNLVRSLETVREVSPDMEDLTYFEALNAAFWVWVRENSPDYILLETGLGGRLDTTTLCNPTLKILTHLERDHFKILGPNMDKIAGEKLAALRAGVHTLVAKQSPFLRVQITSFMHDRQIPFDWVEHQIQSSVTDRTPAGWTHRLEGEGLTDLEVQIPLLGDHQSQNLSTAVLAYEKLTDEWPQTDGPIHLTPKWAGRCQILDVGEEAWVLDGSHTALGGQALKQTLDQIFDPETPRSFYFISTQDRFPWCYLRGLVRPEDELQLVDYPYERLWNADDLKQKLEEVEWNEFTTPPLNVIPYEKAFNPSTGHSTKIFCGSFYWIGAVLKHLDQMRPHS